MLEMDRDGSIATLRLNRPEAGNALSSDIAAELLARLDEVAGNPEIRVVVLTGTGKLFSAGADLKAMRRMKEASMEENVRDAQQSGRVFSALSELPRPVIAAVNGPARGGGVGLVAACDFAIASSTATFAFTEVRLGVVPALISPFVLRKMGESRARRLFLTGETFDAGQAAGWGLVDRVVEPEELGAAVRRFAEELHACAPQATAWVKKLVANVTGLPASEVMPMAARMIAEIRASEEAEEGMAAFLEKRRARWAEKK